MFKLIMLRRLIVLAFILSTAFFAGRSSASAQSSQPNKQFSRPAQMRLDRLIRSGFKEYYGKEGWQYLIIERFYPIGWSKDGKFAYLVEPGGEDCDCYLARLVIQDLRTDKILWEHKHEGESADTGGPKDTLNSFWRKNQQLFSRKLNEYGIRATNSFVLLKPEINFKGDLISTQLRIEKDAASLGSGQISKVVLQVDSKRQGKKRVYEESYPPESYGSLINAKVLGHLKSPFEPLVAFVMIEVHWGWEGPPHTTSTRVIGSSLLSGFH
ncbi:MAG: hypothetical protein WBP93_22660 [Pyrinomonadaceae bacterium]